MLSILTPAFNESANLESLHARLAETLGAAGMEWEWLIVDDHSSDGTFAVIERLARADARVRGMRLARNSGSHVAITCALHHVAGDAAVMMAADHQDPPETILSLAEAWRGGAQVVWAVRRERPGTTAHAGFASIYYWVMRRVAGLKEMPARGADFFLVDRVVIDAFRRCDERNVSVFALITWLGFRQATVEYDKQPRAAGASGWTLERKIRLVVDSVTGFSDLPVRACAYGGLALLALGVVLALWGTAAFFSRGARLPLLVAAMTLLSGVQLTAVGLVGAYVARALDEARRRPLYFIESFAGVHHDPGVTR
jgi:polyisoprenyl-phosphate glycosyltransferase